MGWVPIRGSPEGEPPSGKGPGGCAPSFQKTSEGGRVGPPNVCRGDTPETPPPATIPPSKAQSPDAPQPRKQERRCRPRCCHLSLPPHPLHPLPYPHAARRQPPLSFEGPTPRRSPTPQAEGAGLALPGRLVSRTPCAVLVPYLGVVPRSPSAAFVSYLRPTTQTPDWQTSAGWAGSPMGIQTRQIQAAPISARFQSRSWTASPQARASRKNPK